MAIRAIICDVDGTLVDYNNEPFHSSWDALAGALPNRDEWLRVRDFYVDKPAQYGKWFRKQISLLRGLSVTKVSKHLFPIPYSAGVREFFSCSNKYVRGIVSSSIDLVSNTIAWELKFDFVACNLLGIAGETITGEGTLVVGLSEKGRVLRKICSARDLKLEEVCFVGDNENDIPAFKIVGLPVAFRPKTTKTSDSARYCIDNFLELKKILQTGK